MTLLTIHEPGQTPHPHERETEAIGIDLGTTNSLAAVSAGGRPEILRDAHGNGIVPSVVAYHADGAITVGAAARRALFVAPEAVVSSVKRLMGRGAQDLEALAGTLPFEIEGDGEPSGGMVRLRVAGRSLTPVEISADILRAIRDRAEAALGKSVDKAVITVPAYFDDAARTATRDAGRLAGFEVLRLVNEPTAAALAYGLDKGSEGIYAVYDLGGGTFDISLLRMHMGVFQVLASGGDAALGGDDFDRLVAERFLAQRAEQLSESALASDDAKLVLETARAAKEALTSETDGEWTVVRDGTPSCHRLDVASLEALIAPLVERTLDLCRQVLEDAALAPEQIDGVVLVGGSTRVPLVRRRVAEVFGREPLADINPDEVVALGAALQAEALTRGSDVLLLDVTPLSLGLETMGGLAEKIIRRNTPIPAAQAQEFTTYQDGQTAMVIHVVQGEREMIDQNRSLARFELQGIPPMVAGAARIRVSFAIDADGLLTVTAREQTTGVEQHVEVKPSYGLSEQEMATMLRQSLEHARQDMLRRLLAEARVEAERAVLAVRSALAADGELLSAPERRTIENAVAGVERAVGGTDRETINGWLERLNDETQAFAQRRMEQGLQRALKGVSIDDLEHQVGPDGG